MATTKPRVILGLMTFGPPGTEEKGARITSLDEFNACLDSLQQKGYSELDTARVYVAGEQEAFTKAARWRERGFKIATKSWPVTPGTHSKDKITSILNKSLSELGTDCVDIFYLHAPDRSVSYEETLEACNELYKQGKFKQLGLSNYAAWEVAEIWNIAQERGWVKPTIYQAIYNAITRSIEDELVPCCRKYNIEIVIFNPVAGGLFSGKYKSKDHLPSSGRYSSTNANQGKIYRDRYFKEATFQALGVIEPVVAKYNLTLLETALRWCVHHSALKVLDGKDGIIVGVSSLQQLESNLTDLEKGPLPDEVVKALDEAWQINKTSSARYWHAQPPKPTL